MQEGVESILRESMQKPFLVLSSLLPDSHPALTEKRCVEGRWPRIGLRRLMNTNTRTHIIHSQTLTDLDRR